jgi:iron complex outermembrane receptor protein
VRDTAGSAHNGNRIPGIAPHALAVALDAGRAEGRFASLEFRAQSGLPVDDANNAHSAGYLVTNLRAGLPIAAGTSAFGGIGNLFNVRYNTSVVANAVRGRYFEPAAGRTVYLGLSWL